MLVLLQACSTKTSKEVVVDLWRDWEQMDELLQDDYPESPPIILIHGWNGGEFTWPSPVRLKQLEQQLERDIYFFNYRTGIVANRYPPIEVLEEQLARFLISYKQVDIVAHSMGGLLMRQYLSHHAENPVRRLVFLSTPHFGSHASQVLTGLASVSAVGNVQAAEIQPGSDFLWQLNTQQGAEFENVETLNIYIDSGSWLKNDYFVDPSYAYLPWANNATLEGTHHTLASRFPEFTLVMNFLTDGTLPASASLPKRRNIWLRYQRSNGELLNFSAAGFHRLDEKGMPKTAGFTVCCDQRSSLHSDGGNTVVLENVQDEEAFKLISKNMPAVVRAARPMIDSQRPVSLITIDIDVDEKNQPGMP
jgi:pimeloyl-ACP methyl ester carboxylesterase